MGGRQPSYPTRQFKKVDGEQRNKRSLVVCRHCDEAHTRDPTGVSTPELLVGRAEKYLSHLNICKHFKNAVNLGRCLSLEEARSEEVSANSMRTYIASGRPTKSFCSRGSNDVASTASSEKRQRLIGDFYKGAFNDDTKETFERLLVEFQADNCLPDSFIEKATTRSLLTFLNSACESSIPRAAYLGGHLLATYSQINTENSAAALKKRQDDTCGRVNFLSDVWQNVAKSHLLGCQLVLFGSVVNHGLYPTGSRHDGVAIAEQMQKIVENAQLDGWNIGAIITDNAGQCARARRILAPRFPNIAFLHCFAHDVNNLVKSVLRTSFRGITDKASTAATSLNASSSKWLVNARTQMIATYGQPLCFITLCETRWNSMQGCFASLLRVRTALKMLAVKFESDPEYPSQLRVFGDSSFWMQLEAAEKVIHPLSYASYKMQRDENTLADVVTCFRDIYEGFAGYDAEFRGICEGSGGAETQPGQRQSLVETVEKRWKQCEQPLMLLALFLHPTHFFLALAMVEDKNSAIDFGRLSEYGVYYYRRYIGEDTGGLHAELLDWFKQRFMQQTLQNFNGDIINFWTYAHERWPAASLPTLAVTILSIGVNTATCERYFSELASIHTARRNRMDPAKASKFAVVRRSIRERDQPDGSAKLDVLFKKVINPNERTLSTDCSHPVGLADDDIEEARIAVHQPPPPDDTLDFWQQVFNLLDEEIDEEDCMADDDVQIDDCESIPRVRIAGVEMEPIPHPDTRPFPSYNARDFPQEKKLRGIRGDKYPLSLIFSQATFGRGPYVQTLSP
jgi:hypothetical protein